MYNRQLLSLSYTAMNFKICKTIHVFKGFLCSFHMRNVISNDKKKLWKLNEIQYKICIFERKSDYGHDKRLL